jgi:tetratricopeptide (TPR) repeat protein
MLNLLVVTGKKATDRRRAEEEFLRGNILCDERNYRDAVSHYDKAIELGFDDEVVFNNKGVALDSLGDHREALECYEQAVALSPEYEIAW